MGVPAYQEHRTQIKMAKGREAREAQTPFFFFFFLQGQGPHSTRGIQGVACGLTLAPIYQIGETLRIVLVT